MKRSLIVVVAFLILMALSWMIYSSFYLIKDEGKRAEITSNLSAVAEELALSKDLKFEQSIVIYFNSECDICKVELAEISDFIDEFDGVNLILLSIEEKSTVSAFLTNYALQDYFIPLDASKLVSLFGGVVPQVFIYDSNDELVKHFKGEVRVELILQSLL